MVAVIVYYFMFVTIALIFGVILFKFVYFVFDKFTGIIEMITR